MSKLVEARAALEQFGPLFNEWVDKNGGSLDLPDVLKMYFMVKEEYEKLEDARKAVGAILERMSRNVIPDAMMLADTKTIAIESIQRRFTVSARISASILDKPGAYGWFRDPKQDAADMIQETVNSSSLSKFARTYTDDTGRDLPPEYFRVSTMRVTSVTKL
jgi:hypothetical protein